MMSTKRHIYKLYNWRPPPALSTLGGMAAWLSSGLRKAEALIEQVAPTALQGAGLVLTRTPFAG